MLACVLTHHTDVLAALNSIQKARFNLQLAQVTAYPDVDLNVLGQKDSTAPPNLVVHSLQVSVPVPIFDQNLGGIRQAEGLLSQALAGPEQAQNTLTASLADAWNRYVTYRENVDISLQQVRDQLRAYRLLYARRGSTPNAVGFGDVVTAQQTLATYIAAYIAALGLQWTAVNDVANLLQTDDLFQMGPVKEMAPVPDLQQLPPPGLAHLLAGYGSNKLRGTARRPGASGSDDASSASHRRGAAASMTWIRLGRVCHDARDPTMAPSHRSRGPGPVLRHAALLGRRSTRAAQLRNRRPAGARHFQLR